MNVICYGHTTTFNGVSVVFMLFDVFNFIYVVK